MKVKFFAALKDFYGEELILDQSIPGSVQELSAVLIKLKPEATDLLTKCRFAINNSFISEDSSLENSSEVLVMPPSSGG